MAVQFHLVTAHEPSEERGRRAWGESYRLYTRLVNCLYLAGGLGDIRSENDCFDHAER
jgi:hypothetical protein